MQQFLAKYNDHSEVKAYDVEVQPAAKRPRRSRRQSIPDAGEDVKEDSIRIGTKRLQAMRHILTSISFDAFTRWTEHLNWCGQWKYSAMSDNVAAHEDRHPDTHLPDHLRPNEMQDMASEVGSKAAEKGLDVTSKLTKMPLLYHERLSHGQHGMMLHKGFEIFEAETLHLTNVNQKIACRPDYPTWLIYRTVVEHWDRTISKVSRAGARRPKQQHPG